MSFLLTGRFVFMMKIWLDKWRWLWLELGIEQFLKLSHFLSQPGIFLLKLRHPGA